MLKLTAPQDLMKVIFETLNVIVEEARMDFSPNGLIVRVVDPSHVAMIKMEIDAAAFDNWDVEEISVGIVIQTIKDLVNLGNANDSIEWQFDENIGEVNINMGKIDRVIRPLDNSNLSPPNVPDLELPASVTIAGMDLERALRAARQVGDLVNLSLDPENFTVHVQGETDSVNVTYTSAEVQELNCEQPVRSQYSLTYLLPMAKLMANVDKVTLRFGENFPLRMEYEFNDGAGAVVYFLAPRVEGDF